MEMEEGTRTETAPGAEPLAGGTWFRVWSPDHDRIEVVVEGGRTERLSGGAGGWFTGFVEGVVAGARYRYRLPDGTQTPDPASRYQPEGPHGPSEVVDAGAFAWTDEAWAGVRPGRQVLYELHVGTFTREGGWAAAAQQLPRLARLGVTLLEVMPVAEFPGRWNWGYDGVAPFAPAHVYGRPDDFRRFVDRAHGLGLAVILDVVYNHVGPDGCYLRHHAAAYFSRRHRTDWGEALNFDDDGSASVRGFVLANVAHWIGEYHLDGLRLDATQSIFDDGPSHILREITEHARATAGSRRVWMVAESEPQDTTLVRPPESGGYGMDAVWNDDFHHSATVALTGRSEAYYSDHRGSPQEFISAAKWGYLFQGQHYSWQRQRRGTPGHDVPARCFINFLQNHDQVANSATGQRVHELASAATYRAMTALLLLLPGHAMLFQGQEYAASSPFLYFADHDGELATAVARGRREFLQQFPGMAAAGVSERLADPASRDTFDRCRLDHATHGAHGRALRLHRDLIRLSRSDAAFAAQDARRVHGAVLTDHAFVLRFFAAAGDDRLLLVNLGPSQAYRPAPEPLLAAARDRRWRTMWSSEDPAYGGAGAAEPDQDDGWHLTGRTTLVLAQARSQRDAGDGTGDGTG